MFIIVCGTADGIPDAKIELDLWKDLVIYQKIQASGISQARFLKTVENVLYVIAKPKVADP